MHDGNSEDNIEHNIEDDDGKITMMMTEECDDDDWRLITHTINN